MRKLSVLGAAAALASAAFLPSMAQAASCARHDPTCQTHAMPKAESNASAGTARVAANRAPTRYVRGHRYRHAARTGQREVTENRYYGNQYYNNGYYGPGYRTGFWPGDVVGGAVGAAGAVAAGAVNTAGAIATAPFRAADSYAYYNDGYSGWGPPQSYAERNGFVCTPGTYFKGADGRRHICQ